MLSVSTCKILSQTVVVAHLQVVCHHRKENRKAEGRRQVGEEIHNRRPTRSGAVPRLGSLETGKIAALLQSMHRETVTMKDPVIDELEIERTQAPMLLVLGETGAGKSTRRLER